MRDFVCQQRTQRVPALRVNGDGLAVISAPTAAGIKAERNVRQEGAVDTNHAADPWWQTVELGALVVSRQGAAQFHRIVERECFELGSARLGWDPRHAVDNPINLHRASVRDAGTTEHERFCHRFRKPSFLPAGCDQRERHLGDSRPPQC